MDTRSNPSKAKSFPAHIRQAILLQKRSGGSGGPQSGDNVSNLKIKVESYWARFHAKNKNNVSNQSYDSFFWARKDEEIKFKNKRVHMVDSEINPSDPKSYILIHLKKANDVYSNYSATLAFSAFKKPTIRDAKQYISTFLYMSPDSFHFYQNEIYDPYDNAKLSTPLLHNQTFILQTREKEDFFVFVATKGYYQEDPSFVIQWGMDIDIEYYINEHCLTKLAVLFSLHYPDPVAQYKKNTLKESDKPAFLDLFQMDFK